MNLQEVQNEINTFLAKLNPKDFDEAINWGNLSCIEVCKCKNQDGDINYKILIEEADPSCIDFIDEIQRYLYRVYQILFEVRLEW